MIEHENFFKHSISSYSIFVRSTDLKWYKLYPNTEPRIKQRQWNVKKKNNSQVSIHYSHALLPASDSFCWRYSVKSLQDNTWEDLLPTGLRQQGPGGLWSRSLPGGSQSHLLFLLQSRPVQKKHHSVATDHLSTDKSKVEKLLFKKRQTEDQA